MDNSDIMKTKKWDMFYNKTTIAYTSSALVRLVDFHTHWRPLQVVVKHNDIVATVHTPSPLIHLTNDCVTVLSLGCFGRCCTPLFQNSGENTAVLRGAHSAKLLHHTTATFQHWQAVQMSHTYSGKILLCHSFGCPCLLESPAKVKGNSVVCTHTHKHTRSVVSYR